MEVLASWPAEKASREEAKASKEFFHLLRAGSVSPEWVAWESGHTTERAVEDSANLDRTVTEVVQEWQVPKVGKQVFVHAPPPSKWAK